MYAGVTPCPASSSCTVTGMNSHLPHCKGQGLLALAKLISMAVATTTCSEARSAPLVITQLVGEAFPSAASPPQPAPRIIASLLGAWDVAPHVGATQSASVKLDPEGLGNLCQWECLMWISLADLIGCGNTWGYVGRSGKEGQWHPAEKGKQPEARKVGWDVTTSSWALSSLLAWLSCRQSSIAGFSLKKSVNRRRQGFHQIVRSLFLWKDVYFEQSLNLETKHLYRSPYSSLSTTQ